MDEGLVSKMEGKTNFSRRAYTGCQESGLLSGKPLI